MAIQEVEVPDGMVLFPYFVESDKADLAIECYASMGQDDVDDDNNPIPTDDQAKARKVVKAILDRQIVKYQKRKILQEAEQAGTIITDIIH